MITLSKESHWSQFCASPLSPELYFVKKKWSTGKWEKFSIFEGKASNIYFFLKQHLFAVSGTFQTPNMQKMREKLFMYYFSKGKNILKELTISEYLGELQIAIYSACEFEPRCSRIILIICQPAEVLSTKSCDISDITTEMDSFTARRGQVRKMTETAQKNFFQNFFE